MSMRPNVLFIVWDACRLDYAREHAPALQELAANNLWFENAITPGGYSLPSHVSMVTGEYPHEHGIHSRTHVIEQTPLLAELGKRGYTRYGVSANGFASAKYGFDREFDRFYNTQAQMIFPEGLDVHGYARHVQKTQGEFDPSTVSPVDLLKTVAGHNYPLKSVANVVSAAFTELVGHYETLQRIPHPRFNQYSEFCYSPVKNTETIRMVLRSAVDDTPFFLFANYMDPHHPYAPPERQQRRYCGRTFRFRELARYADLTHPLRYLESQESGDDPDDDTVETIRNLYAGEVRTADEHLGRLLDSLERHGLREDTLVVVTADHGENLGETDRMGETRFGHICSVSDHLMRVPLVIAHPSLEGRDVEEYVSLKNLYELFTDPTPLLNSTGSKLDSLTPNDGIVSGHLPGATNDVLFERHPQIADILKRHMVATYTDDWKVVTTSTGETRAWNLKDDEERLPEEAPVQAVEMAHEQLAALARTAGSNRDLSKRDRAHLEALGYL